MTLSTLFHAVRAKASASPVAPWPVPSSFDEWLTVELDALRSHNKCDTDCTISHTSAEWLLRALDIAIATQNMAIQSLGCIVYQGDNRKLVEGHLDEVVALLDVCNDLLERMDSVEKYIDSSKIVLHWLEGSPQPNATALARTRIVLDSCESMERRCSDLDKCNSDVRKLGERLAQHIACRAKTEPDMCDTELCEVLNGSKTIALFACGVLGISVSFRSKRGLPSVQSSQTTSWSSSSQKLHKDVKEEIEKRRKMGDVVLDELREAVNAARSLRGLIRSPCSAMQTLELQDGVSILRRSCAKLDQGIKPLKGRVKELYRNLISVRMALLGVISQA